MTLHRSLRGRALVALGASGLLGLLAAPAGALAAPWGVTPRYGALPQTVPVRPTPQYRSDYPAPRYANPAPGYAYADPVDAAWVEAEMARRCNIGRLVGGIVGGGVGYMASREDGRTWAVPLGALLGTQMGCNVGAGRAPVPW
ncbi:MAG: glycine zipper 2TM domain-containing protein [Synechococcaceae cyanobacterium]|nr:glycine zipper 2TM domain-containing protein [Synechococcaceae cyanobacterium]